MRYSIFRTTSFKKSFKKLSVLDQELLLEIIAMLANGETLEEKYKDHFLSGNYKE